MNRLKKIEKLCNPKIPWRISRLGLKLEYTGLGEVLVSKTDDADYCSSQEAIEALEWMLKKIKKHSKTKDEGNFITYTYKQI